jgi:hypothetical protein
MMANKYESKSDGRYRISLAPTEVEVDSEGDVVIQGFYGADEDPAWLDTARLAALGVKFEKLSTPDDDPPGTVRVRELITGVRNYYIKNAAGSWNKLFGSPVGLSNTYNATINGRNDTQVVEL